MSLNGLDGAAVAEAHQAAQADAGGWYVTIVLSPGLLRNVVFRGFEY